jgi:hypothetical protein
MKRIGLLICVALCTLAGCATSSRTTVTTTEMATSNGGVASVTVFYDALAPYGEWVYAGEYGRVWRPSVAVVGAEFRPYGPGGYWVHTNYGWSFETQWSWGWAPFHYGRWHLDPGYGWVWVPGTVWAPAWVTWRYGGGYVGWAPLPPAGARIVVETYHPYWCFVATEHFVVRDYYHYAVPMQNYHLAFGATASVGQSVTYGGARWNAGPPPGQISREIGQPIHTASVSPPAGGVPQPHRIEGATAAFGHGPPASGVHPAATPAPIAPASTAHSTGTPAGAGQVVPAGATSPAHPASPPSPSAVDSPSHASHPGAERSPIAHLEEARHEREPRPAPPPPKNFKRKRR